MTEVASAGVTNVGRMRKANEDSYYMDDDLRVYVVADGMGGHKAGEVASRIVVETLQDKMNQNPSNTDGENLITLDQKLSPEATRIMAGIHLANQAVFTLSESNKECKGMGSTVSAILLADSRVIAANVGDSPIFLIRNNIIEELYTPHTYMAEHAKLAPEGAKPLGAQYAHMITRAIGLKEAVQPDVCEIEGLQGDLLLICSDGLSDLLKPEEIKKVATKYKPEKAVRALVAHANKRGGRDNITIIIIHLTKHPNVVGSEPSKPAIKQKSAECLPDTKALPVDYDTEDTSHSAMIHGLCETGGFIITTDAFAIGQELDLTFTDPASGDAFMVSGVVADRKADGIDVRFEDLSETQTSNLKKAIEHNK
ncbi:MAG: SpoIIE family protein phosphatase [Desulfobacterales bacterium]|nr:SpoIIE family protein phosphatase [Desulfobacterales bacterium]